MSTIAPRSPDASCRACGWFEPTLIHNATNVPVTGYCRRRAPAHNGFPAVSADGWCGDFTPGSKGPGEDAPEAAEVAKEDATPLRLVDWEKGIEYKLERSTLRHTPSHPGGPAMSVIHRVEVPGDPRPAPTPSFIGDWESAADEVHSFYEPMVQLSVEIDADHTLHLFCEADQVDRVPAVLARLLVGAR